MDESAVRAHAEAHGAAVAGGDLRRAASDLADHAQQQAPGVMAEIPDDVDSAKVTSLESGADGWVVHITYAGAMSSTTVEALWSERDGRPKIVALRVL